MKNIRIYNAPKYNESRYSLVEENIWSCIKNGDVSYVTSLIFEQEPDYDENAPEDPEISQYPLEDLLDNFYCNISDFYEKENESDRVNSYQEFESNDIEDIRRLLTIIGKHVYNKADGDFIKLIIE